MNKECEIMNVKNIVKNPVICGVIAISIWAYLAVVVTMLGNIPPFEMLCFSLIIGCAFTSTQLTIQKRWHLMKAPKEMWLVGATCLAGTNILYISAFKFAPPVHAEIINYIWPLFVVIGGTIFFKEKLTRQHIIGIALCIVSLFTLHFDHFQNIHGVTLQNLYGYGFALAGAVVCSIYTLVSKKYSTVPNQIVGLYAGLGAILTLIGHFLFEKNVMPSMSELTLLIFMGASAHWASYQAWDRAVKNLEAWKISVIAYFTPALSVALLTIAGFGVFSWPVVLSCVFLFAGSILASMQYRKAAVAS
jgi:drug/metabolite transporter (DMT)-like permease